MNVSDQIISKLTELKESNSISSYSHIKNILKNQNIIIPFTEIKPFKLIRYRRHNDNNRNELFKSSEDLTYRKDIMSIDKFGRANEPGQGFFYCNDHKNQNTGISEIVSIFRGNENSSEEILTISAWNVKEKLILGMILPIDENKGKNKEFDQMKEFYNNYEDSPRFEDLKNLNEFLAKEYTLDLDKHKSNYLITCAFSNYLKDKYPNLDGIIYCSVKCEYEGTNIVLWPETINKKVEFVAARKSVFKKVKYKTMFEGQIIESKSYDSEKDIICWE
jgi:hypothetical protein